MVTEPKKPVLRRFGRVVVRLDHDGLSIRGKHKRTWRRLSWAQVAALATDVVDRPMFWSGDVVAPALEKMTKPVNRSGARQNG